MGLNRSLYLFGEKKKKNGPGKFLVLHFLWFSGKGLTVDK